MSDVLIYSSISEGLNYFLILKVGPLCIFVYVVFEICNFLYKKVLKASSTWDSSSIMKASLWGLLGQIYDNLIFLRT